MLLRQNKYQDIVLPLSRLYFHEQLLTTVFTNCIVPKRSSDFNALFEQLTGVKVHRKTLYFNSVEDVFRFFKNYTKIVDAVYYDKVIRMPDECKNQVLKVYYESEFFKNDNVLKKHSMFKLWVLGNRIVGFVSEQHFLKFVLANTGK